MRQRADTRCDRGCRSTAGGARRAGHIPWIARRRTEQIVAGILVPLMRRVRLAKDDRAGLPQSTGHSTIEIGYVVLEELRTVRRAESTRWFQVLYGNRKTVKDA